MTAASWPALDGGIADGVRADGGRFVDVKVTQTYLVPLSLDGQPVKDGARSWRLTLEAHSLTFTMRNEPRSGIANADPGVATVTFTPEAGHDTRWRRGRPATRTRRASGREATGSPSCATARPTGS